MEDEALYPRTVIRVAIDYQKNSPKAMKKTFLKISGVDSVNVDAEEELVYITGKANPTELLHAAEKMGKSAEILSYQKEPLSMKSNKYQKKMNKGKRDDNFVHVHKAEPYVPRPSLFDSHICRDPYCLHHNQIFPVSQYSGYHHHGLFCEGRSFHGYRGFYDDYYHRGNRCSIM